MKQVSTDWHSSFRALLPNVNICFSSNDNAPSSSFTPLVFVDVVYRSFFPFVSKCVLCFFPFSMQGLGTWESNPAPSLFDGDNTWSSVGMCGNVWDGYSELFVCISVRTYGSVSNAAMNSFVRFL